MIYISAVVTNATANEELSYIWLLPSTELFFLYLFESAGVSYKLPFGVGCSNVATYLPRGSNHFFFVLNAKAHNNIFATTSRLLLRRVGYIQTVQIEGTVFQRPWKEHCYRNTGRLSKFEGAEVMDYGAYPVEFTMLC